MKKAVFLLALLCLLPGCTPAVETPTAVPEPITAPTPAPVEHLTPKENIGEPRVLLLNGTEFIIMEEFQATEALKLTETTEFPDGVPFPAWYRYEGEAVSADTFLDDGVERLMDITTWGPGQTPEGIGIGSTLEELKAAYPDNLVYNDWERGDGKEPAAYTRCYYYSPALDENNVYIFYLNDKKVVTITACGGPGGPHDRYQPLFVMLGDERIRREVVSDKPGSALERLFIEHDDGTEETVLEFPGYLEIYDLDRDGVNELVGWLDGPKKALGIYDSVDNKLIYTDVNAVLGCDWSDYMGLVANLEKKEYREHIHAGFGDRDEVYSYIDGVLTYECTFQEAMGWT